MDQRQKDRIMGAVGVAVAAVIMLCILLVRCNREVIEELPAPPPVIEKPAPKTDKKTRTRKDSTNTKPRHTPQSRNFLDEHIPSESN